MMNETPTATPHDIGGKKSNGINGNTVRRNRKSEIWKYVYLDLHR